MNDCESNWAQSLYQDVLSLDKIKMHLDLYGFKINDLEILEGPIYSF
jgi:hypothetical protein